MVSSSLGALVLLEGRLHLWSCLMLVLQQTCVAAVAPFGEMQRPVLHQHVQVQLQKLPAAQQQCPLQPVIT